MEKRDISVIVKSVRKYVEKNYIAPVLKSRSAFFGGAIKPLEKNMVVMAEPVIEMAAPRALEDLVDNVGESFHKMLFRLISEKGITNAQCYGRANMTKQTFFKIKNNPDYHPQKKTALALCVALELNLDEAVDLLSAAGYAFSPASKRDIIVQYFIEHADYDIFTVDMVLEEFEEEPLTNYAQI